MERHVVEGGDGENYSRVACGLLSVLRSFEERPENPLAYEIWPEEKDVL